MSFENLKFENLKDHQLSALKNAEGYEQACCLIDLLNNNGFEAYLVGGSVRDVILGRVLKDFDMCTSAKPEEMKLVFKDYKLLLQGESFGTVSVVVDKTAYEITSFRGDGTYTDSRHPDSVEFKSSLKEDLERRDFTINALAFHPKKGVVDLVGGLKDIESRVLRTVGDPDRRFDEDALRIARLVRFAVQLGFKIDEKSFDAAQKKASQLKKISKERVYTEFKKMLAGQPYINILDQIFKTNFESVLGSRKELMLFDKAYITLTLSEILGVKFEDVILEKSLKESCHSFEKLVESDDLKSSFIRICDKHSLYDQDQLDLWKLLCFKRPESADSKVQSFSKSDVSHATKELRREHEGRDLGRAVFDLKVNLFFIK
jgi:tRNA nucleotidyltransferase/poly(A) polymerase